MVRENAMGRVDDPNCERQAKCRTDRSSAPKFIFNLESEVGANLMIKPVPVTDVPVKAVKVPKTVPDAVVSE